jgi:hypothetical protein
VIVWIRRSPGEGEAEGRISATSSCSAPALPAWWPEPVLLEQGVGGIVVVDEYDHVGGNRSSSAK